MNESGRYDYHILDITVIFSQKIAPRINWVNFTVIDLHANIMMTRASYESISALFMSYSISKVLLCQCCQLQNKFMPETT